MPADWSSQATTAPDRGPGPVDVHLDGAGLRGDTHGEALMARDERLVIPASGTPISDDDVRALRDGEQRQVELCADLARGADRRPG